MEGWIVSGILVSAAVLLCYWLDGQIRAYQRAVGEAMMDAIREVIERRRSRQVEQNGKGTS